MKLLRVIGTISLCFLALDWSVRAALDEPTMWGIPRLAHAAVYLACGLAMVSNIWRGREAA